MTAQARLARKERPPAGSRAGGRSAPSPCRPWPPSPRGPQAISTAPCTTPAGPPC